MSVQHPANNPAVHAHAHSQPSKLPSGHTTDPTPRHPAHPGGVGHAAPAQRFTSLQWSVAQRLGWALALLAVLWVVLVGSMAVEA